jgi:hypothetical protein
MSPQSSRSKDKPSKKSAEAGSSAYYLLPLVCSLAYSLTLKMEETCSFETSIDFRLTTQSSSQEDIALDNH